jgi:hypothetical protein
MDYCRIEKHHNFCDHCGKQQKDARKCDILIDQAMFDDNMWEHERTCPHFESWNNDEMREILYDWIYKFDPSDPKSYGYPVEERKKDEWGDISLSPYDYRLKFRCRRPLPEDEWRATRKTKMRPLRKGPNKGKLIEDDHANNADRAKYLSKFKYYTSYPSPGHPKVFGTKYNPRDWRDGVVEATLNKHSKYQYISAKREKEIVRHLHMQGWAEYNPYHYRLTRKERTSSNPRHLYPWKKPDREYDAKQIYKYAIYASGRFCPVNLGKKGPAYKYCCNVCGSGVGSYVFDSRGDKDLDLIFYNLSLQEMRRYLRYEPEVVMLVEEWDVLSDIKNDYKAVCNNSLCKEVLDFQSGRSLDKYVGYKELKVKPKRAARVTLEKYPEEMQGLVQLSRFMNFEASYNEKAEKLLNGESNEHSMGK